MEPEATPHYRQPSSPKRRRRSDTRGSRLLPWLAYLLLALGTLYAIIGLQAQVTRNKRLAVEAQLLASQIYEGRHQRFLDIKDADVRLCNAINRITIRDRRTVTSGPATLQTLLTLMRVPPPTVAKLVSADRKTVRRELSARPVVDCKQLATKTLGGVASSP